MGNCGSSGNEAAKPAARKTAVSKQQVTKKETSPAAKAKEEKKTSPVSKPAASTGPSVSVRPPAPASPPSGTPSRSPLDKPARVGSSSNNDIPVTTTNGKPDKKSKGGPVRYHPTSFNPDDTSLGLPRDKESRAARAGRENSMTPRKLRILLLHGHAQTAEDMAKKSGALRSEVKKVAEFIPFESPVRTEDGRVTWYAFDRQPSGETRYTGVEEAVALLSRFAQEEGPFDGVWGFSMGALMAAYVCSLMSAGGVPPELRFKFGIFFASPSPGDPAFPLGTDIEMPSFHCWGESDELIPAARSKQVSESFIQPVTVTHAGGHLMPSAAPVRKSLKAFLVEQRSRITELEAAAAAAASPAEDGELGAQQ